MTISPRHYANRVLLAGLAAGLLSLALPAVALAQDEEPEEEGRAAVRKSDPQDRFCIRETGSRIVATRNRNRSDEQECVSASGRVYTRKDIEESGSADLRDALRRLDPSIR
ncbi:hypothetical protein L599_001000000450 [Luteimonas sp. J16]|jgi:outer membrane cobalamin receptor|uniref:hypothetical protein n=1 Tax=unclassified Luteimonas TaxID=2629088 RepID=UPI0004BAA4F6|nr:MULTISPECIES: hypothetical protein [unclassified Luteimonas]TWG94038.1 hypothetical protein L599_001000000450 [Luteimonas sp. J16]